MPMVDVQAAVGDRTSHNNFDCSTVRKYFLRKKTSTTFKQKSRILELRGMKMTLCLLVLL